MGQHNESVSLGSPILDQQSAITPIVATMGEHLAGFGIISLVVCMLIVVVVIAMRPRHSVLLSRLAYCTAVVGVIGITLWLISFVLITVRF